MGALSEDGVIRSDRSGAVIKIYGLPQDFEFREQGDEAALWHDPCNSVVARFLSHARADNIIHASGEHRCIDLISVQ